MKNKTLILIDDDQDEHLLIQEAVSESKDLPHFICYLSAKLALNELESRLVQPELIVVDINMPVMSGIQFLTEIKKRALLKHIPVIMHSTTGDPSTRQICENLGAAAFLKKTTNFDFLFSIIRSILATSVSA